MALLSTYLPELRQELRDSGVVRTEEYIGNGTRNTWILRNIPIIASSVSVFLEGIPTLLFIVDTATGVLVFTTAPIDGAEIEIVYSSIKYTNDFLVQYLKMAVLKVESIYSIGHMITGTSISDYETEDPVSDLLQIWFEVAKFFVYRDNLKTKTEDSVNWRDGDKAFDETPSAIAMRGLLAQQWDSIFWDMERLILEGTIGAKKSGGGDPLPFGSMSSSFWIKSR